VTARIQFDSAATIARMSGVNRALAIVGGAAFAAHATALACGYVWLDHAHIEDGLALAGPAGWLALFSGGFAGTGFYRPLMSVSLSIDAALGGAAWLYHLSTLAFHVAAAVMTVVAAGALGLPRRAALLAGLLFAVHPAASLVASATAFRSESMIAVALLALVTLHVRGRPIGAALALLAGALTKETALVLAPLLIGALEIGGAAPPAAREPRRRWMVLGAEAIAFALAAGLRLAFAPPWRATFAAMSTGDALGTRLASLWRSATLVVMPVDRTICDAFAIRSIASLPALAGLATAIGLAFLAWRRRGPALLLALALLPSLNLVPVMRWWSPHYLYVPLAFAAMVIAQPVAERFARAWAGAAVMLLVLALMSATDARRFRTDATLWGPEVAVNPACREGQFYVAEAAREAGRLDEAATRYERAAAPTTGVLSYVDRGAALQNLGVVRLQQGRPAEAAAAFRAALNVTADPAKRRRLEYNLAVALSAPVGSTAQVGQ
jgi:tetratricopeptide (TPR) repeat protein